MIRVGLVGFGMAGRFFTLRLSPPSKGSNWLPCSSAIRTGRRALSPHRHLPLPGGDAEDASLGLFVVATPNSAHSRSPGSFSKPKERGGGQAMAITSAEIAELMELATARRVLLAAFHNRRWDSEFPTVKNYCMRVLWSPCALRIHHGPLAADNNKGALERCGFPRWWTAAGFGFHLADQAWHCSANPRLSVPRSGASATAKARMIFHLAVALSGLSIVLSANNLSSQARPCSICAAPKGISGNGHLTFRRSS